MSLVVTIMITLESYLFLEKTRQSLSQLATELTLVSVLCMSINYSY